MWSTYFVNEFTIVITTVINYQHAAPTGEIFFVCTPKHQAYMRRRKANAQLTDIQIRETELSVSYFDSSLTLVKVHRTVLNVLLLSSIGCH